MRRAIALLVLCLVLAPLAVGGAILVAPDQPAHGQTSDTATIAGEPVPPPIEAPAFDRLRTWVSESYQREPSLTLALGLVLVLSPLISIAALLAVKLAKASERRVARKDAPLRQAMQAADDAPSGTVGSNPPTTAPNAIATLQLVGSDATSLPLEGTMVRIGRHEENDIRLASKTVHRYHAVVHLTPDRHYVLTDLSGADGNGVVVNGERVEQATLQPDDVIELGEVKLRFCLGEAAAMAR